MEGELDHILTFQVINVQFHPSPFRFSSLGSDFIKIYDGENTTAPLITTACNTVPPQGIITSTTNRMLILFVSQTLYYIYSYGAKFSWWKTYPPAFNSKIVIAFYVHFV